MLSLSWLLFSAAKYLGLDVDTVSARLFIPEAKLRYACGVLDALLGPAPGTVRQMGLQHMAGVLTYFCQRWPLCACFGVATFLAAAESSSLSVEQLQAPEWRRL